MSRFLTDEQEMFRETARRFARREVEPLAGKIDQEDRIPSELIDSARGLNFFGLYTPTEYGGLGKNLTSACVVLEEIAKASPALAGVLSVEIVLCPAAVDLLATEDQKQRFLAPSAAGEELLAWSMTEPSGAADIPAHSTRLVADGTGETFRLDGSKLFTTQGEAKHILVMARTERDGEIGYGCALVGRDWKGVEIAPYESKLGWRGTNTGSISYSDVTVPRDHILGDLLTANADLWMVNQVSFIAHSVTSLGCAEGLLEKTIEQVRARQLYHTPMRKLQPISYWLGEVHAKIEACRSLIYDAARLFDEGHPDPVIGSICKAYVCDTMFDCTNKLLQMWGGSGIMDSTGVNRYFRDARTNMVAEAASELHYDIISAAKLDEPAAFAGG